MACLPAEDPPAAARYTECRLDSLAMQVLADIDEATVDFIDNYSGDFSEPAVLPARFPNLLVNGSQGIAVGMATNIPPHNLSEVIDAVVHLIDDPDPFLQAVGARHVVPMHVPRAGSPREYFGSPGSRAGVHTRLRSSIPGAVIFETPMESRTLSRP